MSPPDALLLMHLVHGLTVLSFLLYINFLSHGPNSIHGIHSIWGIDKCIEDQVDESLETEQQHLSKCSSSVWRS